MSLLSILGSVTRTVHRTARSLAARPTARRKRAPSRRLELEHLEARDLMAPMAMGINVEQPSSYMGGWMFSDALRGASPWQRINVDQQTRDWVNTSDFTIPIDPATGAPTMLRQWTDATTGHRIQQAVTTSIFLGIGNHYPAGTYTAWWQGDGQVDFGGDVTVSSIQRGTTTGSDGQQYHTASFTVTPGRTASPTFEGQGIQITVTPTSDNDANPFHHAHVWMPDHNGRSFVGQMWQPGASFSPYHPLFLERLDPFDTLRFISYEPATSTVQHWSDRRPWNMMSQGDYVPDAGYTHAAGFRQNAMSPEYIVQLANELHANVWINIPHLADYAAPSSPADSYVLQMANFMHNNLDPSLRVYLEYSNEVWNESFLAARWIRSESGGDATSTAFAQFVATQATRVFDVWSNVFSDRPGQLTRVLVGRQGFGDLNETHNYNVRLLEAMHQQGHHFDAFSVSAYLYAEPFRGNTSVARVLADMRASIPDRIAEVRDGRALADQFNARFVAYEGGLHMTAAQFPEGYSVRPQDIQALNRAALHPSMHGILNDFFRQLGAERLELYNHEQYTARGSLDLPRTLNDGGGTCWGALAFQDQPISQAHRYRALLNFMAGTSTTLSADATAPVAGQTVTLTARVEANAIRSEVVTGNVRFYDGATLLGTAAVVNGMATFETTSLRVGGHALRAIYDGDSSYSRSTAATLRLTVSRSAVDMTLISSAPESVFGQPITLTVQVTAAAPGSGTPTGVVTFRDGTTVLRTVRLVNGVATFTTSALRVGSRALSAVFSGDFRFLRASTDLTQTVNP